MNAKITRIDERPSKYGGNFYYVFFKKSDGGSARTCLYPTYHNFSRWRSIVEKAKTEEVWLTGLIERKKGEVDADSNFYILKGVSNG